MAGFGSPLALRAEVPRPRPKGGPEISIRFELATVRTEPLLLEYVVGSLVRVLAEPMGSVVPNQAK